MRLENIGKKRISLVRNGYAGVQAIVARLCIHAYAYPDITESIAMDV